MKVSTDNAVLIPTGCNSLGKNIAFQAVARKEEGLGLHFEFTAHQTLQQNGWVERKFATLYGRVQSMLNLARLTGKYKDLCQGLWAKCTNTVTKMENLVAKINKDLPFCQFYK